MRLALGGLRCLLDVPAQAAHACQLQGVPVGGRFNVWVMPSGADVRPFALDVGMATPVRELRARVEALTGCRVKRLEFEGAALPDAELVTRLLLGGPCVVGAVLEARARAGETATRAVRVWVDGSAARPWRAPGSYAEALVEAQRMVDGEHSGAARRRRVTGLYRAQRDGDAAGGAGNAGWLLRRVDGAEWEALPGGAEVVVVSDGVGLWDVGAERTASGAEAGARAALLAMSARVPMRALSRAEVTALRAAGRRAPERLPSGVDVYEGELPAVGDGGVAGGIVRVSVRVVAAGAPGEEAAADDPCATAKAVAAAMSAADELVGGAVPEPLAYGLLGGGVEVVVVAAAPEGRALDAVLRDTGTTGAELVEVVARVAEVLRRLHDAGVAHGGVDARGIRVEEGGAVRLEWFDPFAVADAEWAEGMGRSACPECCGEKVPEARGATTQGRGQVRVDADVYGLGVLLLECVAEAGLAGHRVAHAVAMLGAGASAKSVVAALRGAGRKWGGGTRRGEVLVEVARRCVARHEERWKAAEATAALKGLLEGVAPPVLLPDAGAGAPLPSVAERGQRAGLQERAEPGAGVPGGAPVAQQRAPAQQREGMQVGNLKEALLGLINRPLGLDGVKWSRVDVNILVNFAERAGAAVSTVVAGLSAAQRAALCAYTAPIPQRLTLLNALNAALNTPGRAVEPWLPYLALLRSAFAALPPEMVSEGAPGYMLEKFGGASGEVYLAPMECGVAEPVAAVAAAPVAVVAAAVTTGRGHAQNATQPKGAARSAVELAFDAPGVGYFLYL